MTCIDAPKVSIITAVLNGQRYIADALSSVKSQTYQNIEHIIIYGKSTDGTISIIERFRSRNLQLIIEPDGGLYDALNKGIKTSSGDIVGFVHSDDFLAHKAVIATIVERFEKPKVEAVYGDLDYISTSASSILRHWKSGKFHPRKLRLGWMPAHPSLYLRRSAYDRIGGFDTSLSISADYDFVLRYFPKIIGTAEYIPQVLYKMRIGGISNRSCRTIWKKSCEDYRAIRRNKVGGIEVLILKNLLKTPQLATMVLNRQA